MLRYAIKCNVSLGQCPFFWVRRTGGGRHELKLKSQKQSHAVSNPWAYGNNARVVLVQPPGIPEFAC